MRHDHRPDPIHPTNPFVGFADIQFIRELDVLEVNGEEFNLITRVRAGIITSTQVSKLRETLDRQRSLREVPKNG